ncbi:type II toxin-antitoxin system HicB family antitoxin [Desulfolutivibrio sulfoxidireducens]|uniref:type II toxin-antitoxin system HicB family antitoxin n=1 Tax=Desulfolutivibrio sulfoxidireducens TaxID=2773299 RepID=UPI00159E2DB1|nr:type II toxin-antitoxin system HicB family antitoxin [Desulfolutivibrio sulfoxidireducens]QLA17162.1 toxin-antitoxin system HicB family antitoxin [Desulfolutivibrio sulfoxidireducens]QLA20732.1 toxin-antitoxin system HicB family antitoxin [Desulfolutivibrio sulfoxidireducens]
MRYKDFLGEFEYDERERIFHGRVVNIQDVVTFEGRSIAELETALADSVEDYLDFCREIGKTPEMSHSGKFNVRISMAVHRLAAAAAMVQGKS